MKDQISKIRCFLGWFEDNFADESCLMEIDGPGDTIEEEWISCLDHPEYLAACEAIDKLEKQFDNTSTT